MEKTMVRQAVPLKPMEVHGGAGPYAGAVEESEESFPQEEGVAETTCDELTAVPLPHPPCANWGKEVER